VRSAFGVQRSAFGARRSAFGVWRLAFGVQRSAFSVRRSAFGVQRSALIRLVSAIRSVRALFSPLFDGFEIGSFEGFDLLGLRKLRSYSF
jgi:hypothetical protein